MKRLSASETRPSVDLEAIRSVVLRERNERLTWFDKPVVASWYGKTISEVIDAGPRLHSMATPLLTLDARRIGANARSMAAWCAEHRVELAPHGKTTMAPALWLAQLEAGCWGITVANEPQLRVARGVGVSKIILANMLLSEAGLVWISQELANDPTFEFVCWVDSVDAVRSMDEALRAVDVRRPIRVCVEVGLPGERTGARSVDQALNVARAVLDSPVLALAGVACYEGGAGGHEVDAAALERIDSLLRLTLEVHGRLVAEYESDEVVLSAGGSTFFDRVVQVLSPAVDLDGERGRPTRVILRSGGYLIHDDGMYTVATPATRNTGPQFAAAMHVWARVISTPEPGLALLDAGKRDLPYDIGLPTVQRVRKVRTDGVRTSVVEDCAIFDLNDQHAYVRMPLSSPLAVGDVVRLGLSHPCSAFDRWRLIPIIDDSDSSDPTVVDLVRTYF